MDFEFFNILQITQQRCANFSHNTSQLYIPHNKNILQLVFEFSEI